MQLLSHIGPFSLVITLLVDVQADHDRHTLCSTWAVEGECEQNKAFMMQECASSCASHHHIAEDEGSVDVDACWNAMDDVARLTRERDEGKREVEVAMEREANAKKHSQTIVMEIAEAQDKALRQLQQTLEMGFEQDLALARDEERKLGEQRRKALEKKQQAETQAAIKAIRKREVQLQGAEQAASLQANKAETRTSYIISGKALEEADRRSSIFANEAAAAEKARAQLEIAYRQVVEDGAERVQNWRKLAEAAESRAAAAEARVQRLSQHLVSAHEGPCALCRERHGAALQCAAQAHHRSAS